MSLLLAGGLYIIGQAESPLLGHDNLQRLAIFIVLHALALIYRRLMLLLLPVWRHVWYQRQVLQGRLTPVQAKYRRVLRLDDM